MLGDYEKQFQGATLEGDPRLQDDADGSSFTVSARLALPKPLTLKEGWYSLPYKIQIMDGSLGIPDKLSRKTPFAFPMPLYHARYRLQVTWPREVKLITDDQAQTIDTPFFSAHREYTWRANESDLLVDYALKGKQIEAAALPALEQASKRLLPMVESSLSFSGAATVLPAAKNLPLQETLVLSATTSAAAAEKELLANPTSIDSADAVDRLCAIAIGARPGSSDAGALAARLGALKGHDGARAKCLGRLAFQRSDFKQAVLHWSAPQVLVDTDPLQLELAWARMQAGDAKAAAADASRFLGAATGKGSLRATDAVFASLLFERLGQMAPAALLAYSAANSDGPWPRPLLGFMAGRLSEQQLRDAAGQFGPDKATLALNEATLYIGERLRRDGKPEAARAAWRWYIGNAVAGTREALIAARELALLAPADPDLQAALRLLKTSPPKYQAAHPLLVKAAARNVAEAQFELAYMADEGLGMAVNHTEAFALYSKAAAQGHLDSMNNLALLYDAGQGTAIDHGQALAWLERAAAVGHLHASNTLGRRYLYGEHGLARDKKLALQHLTMAARLGNAAAQHLVSDLHFRGVGTEKNPVLSLYWTALSADQGNADGLSQLAFRLAYGHGIEQNLPRALTLWRMAAAKGSSDAQTRLGNAYWFGHGVEIDRAEALRFFEQAAAKGNNFAAEKAGYAYLEGIGTARDPAKGRKLFLDIAERKPERADSYRALLAYYAALDGDKEANLAEARRLYALCAAREVIVCQSRLASMLRFGTGGPANPAEAAKWYRKAADKGSYESLNNLGDMLEKGEGVKQDVAQAIRMYRLAAIGGASIALISMGDVHELGKGMPANPYLAYVYYQAAHAAGSTDLAVPALARVAKSLTAEQVERARQEGLAWNNKQPLPGDAPAAQQAGKT
jgi:TPR repeat protein